MYVLISNRWHTVPSAMGRLIVSVTDPSIAGLTLHDALNDREDRSHVHNYTAVVTLNGSFRSGSSSHAYMSPREGPCC